MSDTYKVYCVKNFYLTDNGDYGFSQYTKIGVSKDLHERTRRFSESGPVKVLWTITCKNLQTANALEKYIKELWQIKFLYPHNEHQYQEVANFHSELFQMSLADAQAEFFKIIKEFKLEINTNILYAEMGFDTLGDSLTLDAKNSYAKICLDIQNNGMEKSEYYIWSVVPDQLTVINPKQYSLFDNKYMYGLWNRCNWGDEHNYYTNLIFGSNRHQLTFAKIYETA